MQNFYEKAQWTDDAKSYAKNASRFAIMSTILGSLGVIVAMIAIFLAIALFVNGEIGAGFAAILNAALMAFTSIMLIIFGAMMHGLSKILLAVFEMTVSENRLHIYNADPDKQKE